MPEVASLGALRSRQSNYTLQMWCMLLYAESPSGPGSAGTGNSRLLLAQCQRASRTLPRPLVWIEHGLSVLG